MKMTATCGIQKFRWREKNKTLVKILGGRQHTTTPAGQMLGVTTPATPAALTPMPVAEYCDQRVCLSVCLFVCLSAASP